MIYEMRTYTLNPLLQSDWLQLYQSEGLPVQQELLGRLVGFFTTEHGVLNQIVHLWAYDSLDDRDVRRRRMASDPRWQDFAAKNKALGAVLQLESRVLKGTSFSPLQ